MENNFSNNEGFSGFMKSTTQFSASVATFITGVDSFKTGNVEFLSTLKTWGKTFSLASLIVATEKMGSRYLDARIELTKTLSLVGTKRDSMMGQLQKERKDLLIYGVTVKDSAETLAGLTDIMGTVGIVEGHEGIIESTMLMAKGFHTSNDAMTGLVGQMSLFNDLEADGITSVMGTMAATAMEAGVSTNKVFENVKSAANMMYLFNMKSDDGKKKFASMATTMTALGANIGSAMDSVQEFRSVGSAVAKSAELSALGLQMGPTQLMQMAYDPTMMDDVMLDVFAKMEGKSKAEQFAISTAASGMFGMSRDEFLGAMERSKDMDTFEAFAKDAEESKALLKKQADNAMAYGAKLDTLIDVVVQGVVDPIMGPLTNALDGIFKFVGKHTNWLKAIAGATVGIFAIQKAAALFKKGRAAVSAGMGIGRQMLGGVSSFGGVGGSISAMKDKGYGGGMGKANSLGRLKYMLGFGGGAAGGVGAGGGLPSSGGMPSGPKGGMPGPKGGGNMMGGMTGAGMLKGAAAMVVLAAAMWVMAKAVQQFSGLKWETLGMAGAALAGFGAIAALFGAGPVTALILAGSIAIAALGVSMGIASLGIKPFVGAITPLLGHGQDLLSVGLGLTGIVTAMAAMSAVSLAAGPINFLSSLTGSKDAAFKSLYTLGKFSKEYATPLKQVGEAIQNIADGMERITKANELGNLAMDSNVNGSGGRMLEAQIRIDMNGTKLADQLVSVWAGDKK